MAGSIGSASLKLTTDATDFGKGLDGAQSKLRQFANQANQPISARINLEGLQQGFQKLQSSVRSMNLDQVLTNSFLQGQMNATKLNWTATGSTIGLAIGAGIGSLVPVVGTVLGGAIGSSIGGFIGGQADEVRDRNRDIREQVRGFRGVAGASGFSASEIQATGEVTGANVDMAFQHFARARAAALTGDRAMQQAFEQLGVRPEQIASINQLSQALARLSPLQRQVVGQRIFGEREGGTLAAALGGDATRQQISDLSERNRQVGGGRMSRQAAEDRAVEQIRAEMGMSSALFNAARLTEAARGNTDNADSIERAIRQRRDQILRQQQEQENAMRINPREQIQAGFQIQMGNMVSALTDQNALLQEQLRLGRALTESEQQLFNLRRAGASADITGPAAQAAEQNRLLNRSVQLNQQYESSVQRVTREMQDLRAMDQRGLLTGAARQQATFAALGMGDLRDPQEIFREQVQRLNAARDAGNLTNEQYQRAANRAGQTFMQQLGANQPTRFAGAMTQGSREAVDIVQRHRFEASGPQQNVAALLQQQNQLQQRQYQILERIANQGGISLATLD